jgi:uncharacterized protein (TIGR02466 family)
MQSGAPPADPLAEAARLYAAGRAADAERQLNALLKARPNDAELQFNAAALADRAGRSERARLGYERVLQLAPTALAAWMNLGSLHLRMDAAGEAERCFRRAAELAPRLPDAPLGLGFALLRQDDTEGAAAAFARAVELDPRRPEALANLGAARLKLGDHQAAIEAQRRALALAPGNPDMLCSLGIAELQSGAAAAAATTLDSLLARMPTHARALGARAAAAIRLGEHDKAAALLDADRLVRRHAIALPPAYPTLTAFNVALAQAAEQHPTLIRSRPGKTTRNGGQTGNLADDTNPALAALVREVRAALDAFLAASGNAPKAWRLNIWATVLEMDGHQATHNHPGGIASGVYYVRVPAPIGSESAGEAGYIEFGRPPPEFGAVDESLIRTIRPEEGAMLLFPSHLWHRTIPFRADRHRISIAFDAVPIA